RPPAGAPAGPPPIRPVRERPRQPDLPPVSRSPWEELFEQFFDLFEEEKEEKKPEPEAVPPPVTMEKPAAPPAPPQPVAPVVTPAPAPPTRTAPGPKRYQAPQPVLPGLSLSRAAEGVIWAEILGPPRAMRPFKR
ncbi:MAG TPA: hypothetical protein GX504_03465, partial [Clostridia bacterium]|nr:hypothetical protein [Clostridia bacterium]